MRGPTITRPRAGDPHVRAGGREGARSKAMSKGLGHRSGVSTPLPTLSRQQGNPESNTIVMQGGPTADPQMGASVETSAIEEAATFRTARRRTTPGSRTVPTFAAPARTTLPLGSTAHKRAPLISGADPRIGHWEEA